MTVKLASLGSRGYASLNEVDIQLAHAKMVAEKGGEKMEVVTGADEGVNQRIVEWCRNNGVPCTVIPIDWENLDKAGTKANSKILEGVSGLIAFWDGMSENVLDAIVRGKKNKSIQVIVNVR